jgi:hypothetical protein
MSQIAQATRCAYPRTRFWRARRNGFEMPACFVPPSGPALDRAGLARRDELLVQPLKHGVRTVFANERVLSNQAQDVHRHRSLCADQDVGVKLATGQTLQVHVGLELGMELPASGVVSVQLNDILHRELVCQCRRPAFQFVSGQQQWVAVLVAKSQVHDDALDQSQYETCRIGLAAHAVQMELLRPQTHALAFVQMTPLGVGS